MKSREDVWRRIHKELGGKTTVVIRESNCAYKNLLNNMTVGVVEETGYKVK